MLKNLGKNCSCNMFLIPWGTHAQLGDGSVAKRLMSTLAYGWVECCNDITGCRTSFFSR